MRTQVWNASLTSGFLRGCSLGPFGTQSKTTAQIRSLDRWHQCPISNFPLVDREAGSNHIGSSVAKRWRRAAWSGLPHEPRRGRKRERTHLISAGVVIGQPPGSNRGLATTYTERSSCGPNHTDGRSWARADLPYVSLDMQLMTPKPTAVRGEYRPDADRLGTGAYLAAEPRERHMWTEAVQGWAKQSRWPACSERGIPSRGHAQPPVRHRAWPSRHQRQGQRHRFEPFALYVWPHRTYVPKNVTDRSQRGGIGLGMVAGTAIHHRTALNDVEGDRRWLCSIAVSSSSA
jgi:hypothetical protein